MTTIHFPQSDGSILDIDISKEYPKVGDRVVVIDSLLYTSRMGTLTASDDEWDFHVDLDAKHDPQTRLDGAREIGVYNFQVIKLLTQTGEN